MASPLTRTPESVAIRLGEAIRMAGEGARTRPLLVSKEIKELLAPDAAKRGVHVETLMLRLLEVIAHGYLADAVLDDGHVGDAHIGGTG